MQSPLCQALVRWGALCVLARHIPAELAGHDCKGHGLSSEGVYDFMRYQDEWNDA